jgi:hypothetical protein
VPRARTVDGTYKEGAMAVSADQLQARLMAEKIRLTGAIDALRGGRTDVWADVIVACDDVCRLAQDTSLGTLDGVLLRAAVEGALALLDAAGRPSVTETLEHALERLRSALT